MKDAFCHPTPPAEWTGIIWATASEIPGLFETAATTGSIQNYGIKAGPFARANSNRLRPNLYQRFLSVSGPDVPHCRSFTLRALHHCVDRIDSER